jgi:predicted ATPase
MTPMFTEIRATNFKSWARLAADAPADDAAQTESPGLPLGKVTGLFGANSSGKTSILQILLLLLQSVESADRRSPLYFGDARSPIRLGTFTDILRDRDTRAFLGLGFSWADFGVLAVPNPDDRESPFLYDGDLSFDVEVFDYKGTVLVSRIQYAMSTSGIVSYEIIDAGKQEYSLTATIEGDENYFRRVAGYGSALPAPIKCYSFPSEVDAFFRNTGFLTDLEFSLELQLEKTYYLGPLREAPQPVYAWTGARPSDVGYNGAGAVPALLASRLSEERKNYRKHEDLQNGALITIEQHVAEWLKELGLVHSFRVAPVTEGTDIYRVYVRRSESSPEVLLTDIGFGVSQVLPVLVLLAYVPEGSTVILEQPEIHLHPAVQSGLADVILEAALVRDVQVIVESHSEHLLRRIQLRVAEQQLENDIPVSVDDVRLWFINQDGADSRANDLKMNEYGEIVNWPKDFFGDRLRETARIAKAGLRRRDATQS